MYVYNGAKILNFSSGAPRRIFDLPRHTRNGPNMIQDLYGPSRRVQSPWQYLWTLFTLFIADFCVITFSTPHSQMRSYFRTPSYIYVYVQTSTGTNYSKIELTGRRPNNFVWFLYIFELVRIGTGLDKCLPSLALLLVFFYIFFYSLIWNAYINSASSHGKNWHLITQTHDMTIHFNIISSIRYCISFQILFSLV